MCRCELKKGIGPKTRQLNGTYPLCFPNTWDGENRLVRVKLSGGVVDTCVYNRDGLRVQVQDSTGTRNSVLDGQAYLMELETGVDGVTTVVYTQEPTPFGALISQWRNV